jgi:uncharacterized protein (TIGR02266 family)
MSSRRTRVEERVTTRVPTRVQVEYARLDDFLDDYAANLSIGGMFVACAHPLDVGARFRLKFRLPDRGRPVETFGEVRWIVKPGDGPEPGMGVRFDELSPADRREVEAWLAGCAPA